MFPELRVPLNLLKGMSPNWLVVYNSTAPDADRFVHFGHSLVGIHGFTAFSVDAFKELYVSLVDTETRDRVVRWLSEQTMDGYGRRLVRRGGVTWVGRPTETVTGVKTVTIPGKPLWILSSQGNALSAQVFTSDKREIPMLGLKKRPDPRYYYIPELAHLDLANGTLLPDSSMWLDAAAMALVVIYVANR